MLVTDLTDDNKKRKLPLFANIFIWFAVFTLIIIVLMWVFQSFFMDDIYQFIKTSELKSLPSKIASEISDNQDLTEYLNNLAVDKDACIMIVTRNGGALYNAHANRDCVIHKLQNDRRNLAFLFEKANNEGGEFFENIDFGDTHNMKINNNYISAKIVNFDGNDYCIIVNSSVFPLQATVTTLNYQLTFMTLVMLMLAVVLALIASKRISSPIKEINNSAKKLSAGDYDVSFNTKGIKELSELGKTLNYTAAELSKTEQYKNELLANISHDMRTPLTMISGYAEVIRDIPGENTPENIQIIIDEANRLSLLVNDSLDIAKMQSGKILLNPKKFSVNELIVNTANRIAKMIAHEGYSLKIEAQSDSFVYADYGKIEQVIYNLINNAVNYCGEDKTVFICQKLINNKVVIEVTDHGEGIPTEEINNIWDRYYKIDKTHKRAVAGSGLGLFIVKTILELHKSNYGVRSTEGKGSTFWFELPVCSDN